MNEEYMNKEVRNHLDLDLNAKVEKTKEIIKETIKKYNKVGLGFSGGTDSLVLLHITLPLYQDIPIVFSNTHHQFPETYKFIDEVKKENKLNFHEYKSEGDKFEDFKKEFGFKTPKFITECCLYHKILPLLKGIKDLELDAFLCGIRGVEHEERAKESIFSLRNTHTRVHPLLFWKQKDILDYVKINNIRCNPLYNEGYTSLGCAECTNKNPNPNVHERAGRGETREKIMRRLRELGYT